MRKRKKPTQTARQVSGAVDVLGDGSHDPCRSFRAHYGHYFLLLILAVLLATSYQILKPYLHTIVMAGILAALFYPVFRSLENLFKGRAQLAALATCLILTLVVIVPLVFVVGGLVQQGVDSFHAISKWLAAGGLEKVLHHPRVNDAVALLQEKLPNFSLTPAKINEMLLQGSSTMGKAILQHGGGLAGNLTGLVGKFFLMLFVFFFLLLDGPQLVATLHHLLPLSTSHEKQILDKLKTVSRSALLGTLVTAVAQGFAGGIAFLICGFPALFWGVMMAFASLIPAVGTALIWLPAVGYLFLSGRWGYGIFLLLWSVLVVGSIDNFLRPLFMKGAAEMSTVLIFFAILGGIGYFGLIGLLYGPLIFGLTLVMLYIYRIEFASFLDGQDRS
ncbi:MAG: AI-2E family transporter [Thermodesulfobacteriota bacterium]